MLLEKELHSRIETKKKILNKLRPFPPHALARLKNELAIQNTYNSNAIEGSTLTASETRLVIEEGITIGGKTLKEHEEAIGHKKAIDFIEKTIKTNQAQITKNLICKLHSIIMNGILDDEVGAYRLRKVWIEGASFVPAMPSLVPGLMKDFLKWLTKNPDRLSPVELCAMAHQRFVFIHPFIDGNGRIARLLMNIILMKKGYPPAIILKNERKKYIRTLELAHNARPKAFVNFIGRSVERSLLIYLDAFQTNAEKYITLSEAAKNTPYSQEYLSLLARKGRLEALKHKRNWLTTKKAVRSYLESVSDK